MQLSFEVAGKLMLSGEWNILEQGRSCIALPTQGMSITIEPADSSYITSAAYNLHKALIEDLDGTHYFLAALFDHAYRLLEQASIRRQSFHITIINKPQTLRIQNGQPIKIGVGSSAGCAVGIIKAVTSFHGIRLDKQSLFAQATQAHQKATLSIGSGFDVAVAVMNKTLCYTKNTRLTPLHLPDDWHITAGFSGLSASSSKLIHVFEQAKKNNPSTVSNILSEIEAVVQALAQLPKVKIAMALIQQNSMLLSKLSALCDNRLETPPLQAMIAIAQRHGAAAKFSGAGGGDCVIALCPTVQIKNQVIAAWGSQGFCPIDDILLPAEISTVK